MIARVALIGARGHTGGELVRLIARHPHLTLTAAGSRALAGRSVGGYFEVDSAVCFEALDASTLAQRAHELEVVILALPNGEAAPFVDALDAGDSAPLIVDLSADYRFDPNWFYGLPELTGPRYQQQRTIANPGCYATAMSLALAPIVAELAGPAACFGVSGYSGAGTTPSPRNDPDRLRDNLLPYALSDHLHEREVSHHLGTPIAFTPHVAPFFRGISMTVTAWLRAPVDAAALASRYAAFYREHRLVRVGPEIPEPRALVGDHGAAIGGFASGRDGRVTVVCALDNLLKGAASQAIQNINLGLALPLLSGLDSHD